MWESYLTAKTTQATKLLRFRNYMDTNVCCLIPMRGSELLYQFHIGDVRECMYCQLSHAIIHYVVRKLDRVNKMSESFFTNYFTDSSLL